jgi:hypothetical protein
MTLINADHFDKIEDKREDGTVFIGMRHWVQTVEGATFPQADLAEARRIASDAFMNDSFNIWQAVLDWATSKGYNSFHANMLAGHCWSEVL